MLPICTEENESKASEYWTSAIGVPGNGSTMTPDLEKSAQSACYGYWKFNQKDLGCDKLGVSGGIGWAGWLCVGESLEGGIEEDFSMQNFQIDLSGAISGRGWDDGGLYAVNGFCNLKKSGEQISCMYFDKIYEESREFGSVVRYQGRFDGNNEIFGTWARLNQTSTLKNSKNTGEFRIKGP
jgi:hypothetical protein